ncbi:hypothetical protein QUF81_03725 [Peribacillus simplex]|uniref:hypothetical protein n=1 Tax=Peribacillus simplex TaxID=1478 RepID=UPI0025A19F01|nr:hypothetical protein [Peribacillus simplex]MDM5292333.1 hypothetical protein [Peribacillus simplex]
MKKMVILPLVAILSFIIFLGDKSEAAINNKPGDIIVTKSTSGSGVLGHSGIYIDTTHILHSSGWASEPYPKVISESQWHSRYAQSKVIRPNSSTIGSNAAEKAKSYFKDKKIPYKVTSDPTNISKTYCSELVWYSYYKAGKSLKVPVNIGGAWTYVVPKGLVKPYDLIDSGAVSKNGFSFIDNKW